jgi:NAD(P)-dependent dehydrogenase (short-subunit alcohol dehydrogenase family)
MSVSGTAFSAPGEVATMRVTDRRLPAVLSFAIGKERSMPRLAGKVALVTGAGSGIGRATAILFAREGAKVAIAEIDASASEETAHLAGNDAIAIRADVTDPDSLQAAFRVTVDKFGRLDVLHNNAGGSTAQDDTAVNAPLEEFWRAIKLDLYGTFLGCRFGIPELIRAGGGSVINMSSNVALLGSPAAIATPRQRAGSLRSPVRLLSPMPHREFASMRLRHRRR